MRSLKIQRAMKLGIRIIRKFLNPNTIMKYYYNNYSEIVEACGNKTNGDKDFQALKEYVKFLHKNQENNKNEFDE